VCDFVRGERKDVGSPFRFAEEEKEKEGVQGANWGNNQKRKILDLF
jgi:hypothetical protein